MISHSSLMVASDAIYYLSRSPAHSTSFEISACLFHVTPSAAMKFQVYMRLTRSIREACHDVPGACHYEHLPESFDANLFECSLALALVIISYFTDNETSRHMSSVATFLLWLNKVRNMYEVIYQDSTHIGFLCELLTCLNWHRSC